MFRNAKIQFISTEKGGMDGSGNPLPDTETIGEELHCFLTANDHTLNARSGGARSGNIQGLPVDERFLKAKYQVWIPKRAINFFEIPAKCKVMQEGREIGVFEILEKYNVTIVGQIQLII